MSPPRDGFTPVYLSADVLIGAGMTAVADTARLNSPFRKPIWINEIRWTIRSPFQTSQINPAQQNLGGSIRCKLMLGRIALSHTRSDGGFIPIWNYCTAYPNGDDEVVTENAFGPVFTETTIANYRWILPKPLYVPNGNVLSAIFSRQMDDVPGDARVTISYAGWYAPERERTPAKIDVPFVTAFLPGPTPPGPSVVQSSDLDLVNIFQVPLRTQRFIARVQERRDFGLDFGTIEDVPVDLARQEFPRIQIRDSWGYQVVRDFQSVSTAIDSNFRAWTFDRVLLPKERYNVTIDRIVPQAVNGASLEPMITIVGYRQEVLK